MYLPRHITRTLRHTSCLSANKSQSQPTSSTVASPPNPTSLCPDTQTWFWSVVTQRSLSTGEWAAHPLTISLTAPLAKQKNTANRTIVPPFQLRETALKKSAHFNFCFCFLFSFFVITFLVFFYTVPTPPGEAVARLDKRRTVWLLILPTG